MIKREALNYVLQNANKSDLEILYKNIDEKYEVKIINQPTSQTLLVPVKDPITLGEFYAGEALVTSCIVKVGSYQGWSMVQDDYEDLALYIATIDAVFECGEFENEIKNIYEQTVKKMQQEEEIFHKKVNATKVSFDLM